MLVITRGDQGGAQTHLLELCRALRGEVQFLVVIGGRETAASPLELELRSLGVEVARVRELGNSLSPGRLLLSVWQLRRLIHTWSPDVLHLHSAVAGVVGRLAGWLSRCPVIYTVHGFGFKPQVAPLRRTLALLAERLLAPLTARMICVSDSELTLAQRLPIPRQRLLVISNGIADTAQRADPGRDPASLMMVARMEAPKRHDLLLQALRVLQSRGRKAPRAVLAGEGPLWSSVQSAAQGLEAVELPGDVKDVPVRLANCQIFVLLSDHEAQPISIIEAMRAGLPIVASDLPEIRHLVSHGKDGLLTINSPEAVADALEALLDHPQKRVAMGQAARAKYEREFGSARLAQRVAAVYTDFPSRAAT
jgi:glycosyltransferase involved in cell wall biosynthesis